MFEYNLKGKHVILSLDQDYIPYLESYGISGSPLFAKVHRMEESGLWLESDSFNLCPQGIPKLFKPTGEAFCRAHIFIPAKSVVSVVAFPGDASHLQKEPSLHQIGFRPKSGAKSPKSRAPRRPRPKPGPRKRIMLPGSHSKP